MEYNSFVLEGHGLSELTGKFDPGATAQGYTENGLVDKINKFAKEFLDKTSLLIHYDEQNYIDFDIKGNTYTAKAGVTVHINAGGGTGAEIWVPLAEKHFTAEDALLKKVTNSLNIPNRGIKSRYYDSGDSVIRSHGTALSGKDYYKEIRDAWGIGVSLSIFEVGFIDTSDADKMNANLKLIGYHVAEYICELCGVKAPAFEEAKPVPQKPDVVPFIARIQNDAIYVLNGPGKEFDITMTVYKGSAYTITKVTNGYGRLKSGAGWINLKYTTKV